MNPGNKQQTVILHLGDHDPSGVDMTRDIQDRLELLSDRAPIEVRRIALTMEQVRRYNPPPNPAKITDSRSASYIDKYGDKSWELDALEPRVLVALIKENVISIRDNKMYQEAYNKQENGRKSLITAAKKWDKPVK
jgi:hypothetical protein